MDYQAPCQYSVRLIDRLKSLDTKNVLDFDLINRAIYWAKKYHGDQKRKSGEPYYSHPLEVAYMISKYKLKTDVIVASILHDIIEDTEITAGMIIDNFSWRIAQIVDRLTRNRSDGTKLTIEEIITNAYQKQDKEVLLIKLIDRIHNIKTIKSMSVEKQHKTIDNTIQKFLSLAIYSEYYQLEKTLNQILSQSLPMQNNYSELTKFFSFFNDGFFSLQEIQSETNQLQNQ